MFQLSGFYCRYLGANVSTIWVHAPLGISILLRFSFWGLGV